MDNTRLVRICYNRLSYFDRPDDTTRTERRYARYNWVTLVRMLLEDIGYTDVWIGQDPAVVEDKFSEICIAYANQCKDIDASSLITSTSNPLYILTWSRWRTAKYLLYHLPFSFKSLVAQVRLNSRGLYFKGSSLTLGGEYCVFCDSLVEMSLEHVLLRCRLFDLDRSKCSILSSLSFGHLLVSISTADEQSVKSLCYYIIKV